MQTDEQLVVSGMSYFDNEHFAEALAIFTELNRRHPALWGFLNLLGTITSRRNEFETAISHYKKAIALAPDTAILYFNLAQALLSSNRAHQAVPAIERAIILEPEFPGGKAALLHATTKKIKADMIQAETATGRFFTYHSRPMQAEDYLVSREPPPSEKIAIVLQGPIVKENAFTIETIKLYRKNFPTVDLIVSTWENEDAATVQSLLDVGATVVLQSKYPTEDENIATGGISQVNFALCGTQPGLQWAKSQGFEYVLRTKTDQRLYSASYFIDALNLMDAFPLKLNPPMRQERRLVVLGHMLKYMPYSVSEQGVFGTISDVTDYFSAPMDMRPSWQGRTLMQWAQGPVSEAYYFVWYMKLLGREPEWTLDDSWNMIKDHFVIMDLDVADFYFQKYERHQEHRGRNYGRSTTWQYFGFSEWLRLYVGKHPMNGDPRITELYIDDPIDHILKTRGD